MPPAFRSPILPTLATAVVAFVLVTVLHFEQRARLSRAVAVLNDYSQAGTAVAGGLVDLALGDAAQRQRGLEQLQQAREVYARHAPLLPFDDTLHAELDQQLADFSARLARWPAAAPPTSAEAQEDLRGLLQTAQAIDALGRQGLHEMRERQRVMFYTGVALAGAVLASLVAVLLRSEARRKRSEAVLRDSEEHYRGLIEQTGAGIVIVRDDGRIGYLNPRGAEIAGCDAALAVGRDVAELVCLADRARLRAAIARLDDGAGLGEIEDYAIERGGPPEMPVQIELRFSRAQLQGQAVLVGVFQDISQRRRDEQALLDAAQRVQAIEDSMLEQLVVLDDAGRVVSANSAWREFVHRHVAQRVPAAPSLGPGDDFLPVGATLHRETPERAAQVVAGIRAVLSGAGELFTMEIDCALDDGMHWFALSVTPLRAAGRGAVVAWADITRRHRAEEALRASEASYRTMVNALAEGVVIFDIDTNPLGCNPAAERMLGVTQDEMRLSRRDTADSPVMRLDGSPLPFDELPLARVLASGRPVHGVVLGYRQPTGQVVWLNVNGEPLRDGVTGDLTGAVISFEDISDRKRAEDDLERHRLELEQRVAERTLELQQVLLARQQSDAFLRTVADNQPTLIAYWDRERRLRFANKAWLNWFGKRHDEVIGRGFAEVLGNELFDQLSSVLMPLFAGETVTDTCEMTGGGGRRGHFLTYRLPETHEGQLQGYFFFATEITEIRRAEQRLAELNRALVEAEKLSRLIADNVPGRVSYWDREGRCRFVNRHYCEWHGLRPEDVLGRRVEEAFGAAIAEPLQPHVQAALAGEAHGFERTETAPDGSQVNTWAQCVPDVRGGGVQGYFVLVTDITPARQSERRLTELNEALVQERDRAERANRAKSAFLANMSHEIRTPMNAIIGLTHLLRRDMQAPQQIERLGKVADAAHHLLELINDILDLSKIEAGKLRLEQTDFDLAALLRRVVSLLADRAREKRLDLQVQADGLPQRLRGDPTRLSQALLNLLSNAVKFTERGGVRLEVTQLSAAEGRCTLRFEVIDSGIGIGADKLPLVFSAFEQADSSTTRRFGGTGLGLAITRRLVELMEGEVGVSSEAGAGSRFWFVVPFTVAEPRADSEPAAVQAGSAEQQLRERHAGVQVLLAEDNAINQDVAIELLSSAGLAVDVAENGREALALARRKPYALILMDMQMPEMDGLQATAELRALPALAEVPILAMTANAFEEDRRACIEAGMNDHIAKPVDPQALYEVLLRWLDRRPAAPPPLLAPPPPAVAAVPALDGIEGFDPAVGMRLTGLRPKAYDAVLRRFVKLYADGIPALPALLAPGGQPELVRAAHSLRGACAVIGAQQMQGLAQQLESLGRAANDDAARAALAQEAQAVQGRLRELVSTLSRRLA